MTDNDELIREIQSAVSKVLEEMHDRFDRLIGKPRQGVSTDKRAELVDAAKALLPHIEASDDFYHGLKKAKESGVANAALDYMIDRKPPRDETPAQKLRREAEEIEAKDSVIKRFRDAVAAFE